MAATTDDLPKSERIPPQSPANPGVGEKLLAVLMILGPGLVTGASDDDPSGIATYSQIGAQFGYGMLWTMVLTYPLMTAIQEVSARIGRVTGCGLSANLRRCYPRWLLFSVIGLMAVGNVFNLGADIGAMGAAAQLLLPAPYWLYVVVFGLVSLLLQIFVPYSSYVKYLKWLTLSLFAYVGTAFFVKISWGEVLHSTFLPHLSWNKEYLTSLIAVLGTTISPYLFFWQASQEVEDLKCTRGEKPLKRARGQAPFQLGRIRIDTYFGMALSNVVAFFIILTAAATLHAHGQTDVTTAAQAAQALTPLAGKWASTLFVCGIIGTGMLAIPVLAGSAAYAFGEGLNWNASLEKKPSEAVRFYAVIAASTLVGIALNFIGINPIKALVWAAVLNGVLAAPLMAVIMHMATSKKVMDKFTVPPYLRVAGWIGTVVMLVVAIGVFATWK